MDDDQQYLSGRYKNGEEGSLNDGYSFQVSQSVLSYTTILFDPIIREVANLLTLSLIWSGEAYEIFPPFGTIISEGEQVCLRIIRPVTLTG